MGILFGGPTPEDGQSAYEIAVANGFIGTEAQWLASLTGPQGLSAYEIAAANGYTGTITQWLTSLIGPQGPAGPTGPSGSASVGLIAPEIDFGFGTSDCVGISAIGGGYTKIGRLVFVQGQYTTSDITGKFLLPHTAKYGAMLHAIKSTFASSTSQSTFTVAINSKVVNFSYTGSGVTHFFHCTYFTDQ